MKKFFSEPEIEVNKFKVEDVITTSGGGSGNSSIRDEDELPKVPAALYDGQYNG